LVIKVSHLKDILNSLGVLLFEDIVLQNVSDVILNLFFIEHSCVECFLFSDFNVLIILIFPLLKSIFERHNIIHELPNHAKIQIVIKQPVKVPKTIVRFHVQSGFDKHVNSENKEKNVVRQVYLENSLFYSPFGKK
jgi:hypothetical protein